jgi:hypothetical protein
LCRLTTAKSGIRVYKENRGLSAKEYYTVDGYSITTIEIGCLPCVSWGKGVAKLAGKRRMNQGGCPTLRGRIKVGKDKKGRGGGGIDKPHPLYPPLLKRLGEGEGE